MSRRARNCAYLRLTEEEKELARQSRLLNPLVEEGHPPSVLPERWSAGHTSSSDDEGMSSSPSAVPSTAPSIGKKGGKDSNGKRPKLGEKKKKDVRYISPCLLLLFPLFQLNLFE